MHYLLKARHYQVIYLGTDISFEDLRDACCVHKPDYIFTLINEPFAKISVQQYLDTIGNHFPHCQIVMSGYQVIAKELKIAHNITILRSLDETVRHIDEIKIPQLLRVPQY